MVPGSAERPLPVLLAMLVLGAGAGCSAPTGTGVTVAVGPTPIPRGDAQGARDITVTNGIFAVSFAVDSAPPWGVARGGIVDVAILEAGKPGYDFVSLVDFMPDRWSSWPTTYQDVTVEAATPRHAVVRTRRDWGEVQLDTTFRIAAGDSRIHVVTRMTNAGERALTGLATGYVAWPDGGFLFGVPGLYGSEDADEAARLADWSASYDAGWVLGLHAPFAQIMERTGRDRYRVHELAPGSTATFEAWLQIEPGGSLAPLVAADIGFRDVPAGRIRGTVRTADGAVMAEPAVVVTTREGPYAWTLGADGKFSVELPAGQYTLYATAAGHAPGEPFDVTLGAGEDRVLDFSDVRPPGRIELGVREAGGGPHLDARVTIREGYRPLIGYFGRTTYFTELEPVGRLAAPVPPGDYALEISAGGGFVSLPRIVKARVPADATLELDVDIEMLARPRGDGWYSADLHHHSDVLDGFTEPEYVLRSELAAGVDVAFLSDHDSVINNARMRELAAARGRPFIAGTEFSSSWGHFNGYPLHADAEVQVDTGTATVQQVFAEARRMGADVIEVNHPYSTYGYFESHEAGTVPGGYDAGFDLVEIEPLVFDERNARTLQRVWNLWNEGRRVYLAAGSDVHDVWAFESGSARTYVHVDGELTVDRFVAALKAGHAYATQGPLVYPDTLFGTEVELAPGAGLELGYRVQAVNGLAVVRLIERGRDIGVRHFGGEQGPVRIAFAVEPGEDTWYSLALEDGQGRRAYTNPVWVHVAD
ncbi:MAG: CehA/McbA family metallohydrolase [Woeseiaceae bacterium]|nr:CehA/McbA family metallohydrolase [Woeseiaceae bacterium]